MKTIYLVSAEFDYEGGQAIKAFCAKEAADAFAESCRKHSKHDQAHPAGYLHSGADRFEVEEIEVMDWSQEVGA